ncbi:MAG: flagellar protein FlaG [Gammaproteobacteria bacterium SHHR-1]|uniref:flagellar protein FlaG n=1 Tax=Magnetovirga frankeli TaxID=947516 RepID=UPI001AF19FD8|nr:flagellar protein FlaG [gamma proteobacterium SS-5]
MQRPERANLASTADADPSKLEARRAEKAEEQKAAALDASKLREMVDQSNQTLDAKHMRLQFSVHEETGSQVVQVFDRDTDKLLRQYPPEEYLSVAEQIQEMGPEAAMGMMFKVEA